MVVVVGGGGGRLHLGGAELETKGEENVRA
jgi:hypothetical protein